MQRRIGATVEIWVNLGPDIPMVPYLHLGNVYIKSKLRVRRAYKCNRLVGAINALAVTGLQTTRFHTAPYRADIGNFEKFGARYPY